MCWAPCRPSLDEYEMRLSWPHAQRVCLKKQGQELLQWMCAVRLLAEELDFTGLRPLNVIASWHWTITDLSIIVAVSGVFTFSRLMLSDLEEGIFYYISMLSHLNGCVFSLAVCYSLQ